MKETNVQQWISERTFDTEYVACLLKVNGSVISDTAEILLKAVDAQIVEIPKPTYNILLTTTKREKEIRILRKYIDDVATALTWYFTQADAERDDDIRLELFAVNSM